MNELTVSVWQETVTIPTYAIGKPDKNPMFFEKRIYQGSSGVVYPNPVIEKIEDEKMDKDYLGLFLENKYLKIMVLPELGGRIQMAFDKVKQRHFIYYNQVIKPALVGLTGPWISGGIEFNWPQHHRPSTFEPIDFDLSENSDGSKTIWVNEVEKMFHTKGMAGFTLYPDKAYIEIKAKLYNRSTLPQTFLWWANPAVKVNNYYQSVFPPDVNAVFDHGKRDVSDFPIATGTYYKVDYSPGTDISMYKNIPVPTSYMAINSEYDFVGGYEHDSKGGLLHVADHHVSPGKKQWTWGHSDFGQAWDRNLTDEDGPYIELMTGVFTDNQPDFSWLMPNEEKSFTQYFLPYQELGMVKNASKDILLAADAAGKTLNVKVYATSEQTGLKLTVSHQGVQILNELISVSPEQVFSKEIIGEDTFLENEVIVTILSAQGIEMLCYEPSKNKKNAIPQPASPALPPALIETTEQLFLTGQHLEQYRHATYDPIDYYTEALRREPSDIRTNNALGKLYLRKGKFEKSESYLRTAIDTSTGRNPNPYDSEPYYNLGICLRLLGRHNEAYEVYFKATWSSAWKDSSYLALSQIDMTRQNYSLALTHIGEALNNNGNSSKAYVIKAAVYRKLKQFDVALQICGVALSVDRFNLGALNEKVIAMRELGQKEEARNLQSVLLTLSRGDERNFIEYSLDYAAAGLFKEATQLLQLAIKDEGNNPMVFYSLGYFYFMAGEQEKAVEWYKKAENADPYICFPNRLEDIAILETASNINPQDAKAPYYLGNLYYDKRQYADAIRCWEQSEKLDKSFPTVLRNLGIAYFNKKNDAGKALNYFERALSLDSTDARVLMELDQLYKRLNREPHLRLKFLESHLPVTLQRDDLYLERISLLNFAGDYDTAVRLIQERQFHPWEGGEGKVSGQYTLSLIQLARKCIQKSELEKAIEYLTMAQVYPFNLGEGKLYGAQENDIFYWLGCVHQQLGMSAAAKEYFVKATIGLDEPSAAIFYNDQQPDKIFFQGLAHKRLGNPEKALQIFSKLVDYGKTHAEDDVKLDYFAVSLPNLLIFEDDLNLRNRIHTAFIQGLGHLGLDELDKASELFSKVLELDASHTSGKVLLEITREFPRDIN
jgi:tetratricopeptide (TPR) repeat protein